MSSERDSFAKGIFSTFAKGFLLHILLLKVNYSPLRVKKSRSHDMGQCLPSSKYLETNKYVIDAIISTSPPKKITCRPAPAPIKY
jgi:hypothetical protein